MVDDGMPPKSASVTELSRSQAAGVDADDAIDLLRRMVDIPSPTGREEPLAKFIAEWCREQGLPARLQPLGPGRANVIASLAGTGRAPSLLFNGHLDTSYTGDEEHLVGAGYKPRAMIRDGWLFGLGAFNMKSGLAAALMAVRTIARRRERLAGELIVAGVAGEIEKACVDEFQGPEYTGYGYGTARLLAHGVCAGYGIVCEPTNFKPSHGHLGALWVRVALPGDMRHTTFFDNAADVHAIYDSTRIVDAIRVWGRGYADRNAYQGQPAHVHVNAIQGGWPWRISRTPHTCRIYTDIRFNPRQRPEAVLQEFTAVVRATQADGERSRSVEVDPYVIVPSVIARGDEPVFEAIRSAHARAFGNTPPLEFRGPMADSVHMNIADIPTVTYGLGPGGNFDVANPATGERGEQIRVEDYLKLITIYMDAARHLCGGEA